MSAPEPPVGSNVLDEDDEFYTGCTDECGDDCMADHRGEE